MTFKIKTLSLILVCSLFGTGAAVAATSKPHAIKATYNQTYRIHNYNSHGKHYYRLYTSLYSRVTVQGHPSSVILNRGPNLLSHRLTRISRSANSEVWSFSENNVLIPIVYSGHAKLVHGARRVSFTVRSSAGSSITKMTRRLMLPRVYAR